MGQAHQPNRLYIMEVSYIYIKKFCKSVDLTLGVGLLTAALSVFINHGPISGTVVPLLVATLNIGQPF